MGWVSYAEDIRDRQADGLERQFTGGWSPCIYIPTQPGELKNIQQKKNLRPSGNKILDVNPKNQSQQANEYQNDGYEQRKEWEYTYRKRNNKNPTTVDKAPQEQEEIRDIDFVQDWERYSSEDTIDLHKPNK